MRKTTTFLTFTLALVVLFGATSASFASRADDLLRKARRTTTAASQIRDRVDRVAKYNKAIKDYEALNTSTFSGTLQAAEALYETGQVQRTIAEPKNSRNPKDQHNSLYQAHETLKRLINLYDKPRSELTKSLDDAEIAQVNEIVRTAKGTQLDIEDSLNKLNAKDPKFKFIDFFVKLTGKKPGFSYWFAIILITVLVKIIITPLTKAQFKSMKEMQKIGPLVKEIQEKHKGDQKTIGEKTMALYKEHHINPFASCLPLLIQMPILMLLYYTIRTYEFEFAHGRFLWIGSSLSHMLSVPAGFGGGGNLLWLTARNLSEPDLILVVLYVISMYISTKLSSVDPTQAEQQKMMAIVMPVMFAFLFAGFPSAFLLYWLVFNILQTGQQYLIMHKGQTEEVAVAPPAPPADTSSDAGRVRRRRRRR